MVCYSAVIKKKKEFRMRTRTFGLALITATLLYTGCASKQEQAPQTYNWQQELEGAPSWVTDPESSNGLSAVASAKITGAGIHFAEVESTSLAKDKMARQIETKISNMTKNFTQTTGSEQAKVDKVVTDVSRQLSKQVLYNTKVQKRWISKSGTMWVLVSADAEQVKGSIKSSFNDANAKHQQTLAKETLVELEDQITKNF